MTNDELLNELDASVKRYLIEQNEANFETTSKLTIEFRERMRDKETTQLDNLEFRVVILPLLMLRMLA